MSTPTPSARAPRYTSYPPATHFTDAVGPDALARWLGAIPPESEVSVYIHVPFCRRLCWFCACRTQGTKTDAPLEGYVEALGAEVATVAAALPAEVRTGFLHLGGGTPTLLPPRLLSRVFAMIDDAMPRAEGGEVSIEVDPTEIDGDRLDTLAEAGVTRASLGVQDFDPRVQDAIGRRQDFATTQMAVRGLRARGIRAINLDLLYGLPHQTEDSLRRTLDQALALEPDRFALYGYAHVPWASKRQAMIREADLPAVPDRLRLAQMAAERLAAAGYVPIGIDHFARPDDTLAVAAQTGRLRRNFQGYTTDNIPALIGLGASAISCLPGGYAQNAARTADWAARVRSGRLATIRGHALTDEDRLRGAVIERLLCDFAVNPGRFAASDDVRALTRRAAALHDRAVTLSADGALAFRPAERHLARTVATAFDAYAAPEGRHSLAV